VFFKQRNKQGSWASSHKSGGLVSVLASGLTACPKNARDLTETYRIRLEDRNVESGDLKGR
jgi:hypothetical protein